jgi:hypothetical protein
MDAYEKKTGGNVLAISHNGNLSNGLMFPVVEAFGKKLDREYVETQVMFSLDSTTINSNRTQITTNVCELSFALPMI